MKRNILKSLFAMMLVSTIAFINLGNVNAATGTATVKVSTTQVLVGNTVNATVTIASTSPLGAWNVTLNYDTAKLRMTASNAESWQLMVGSTPDGKITQKTYSFSFKAIASGNARIYIGAVSVLDLATEAEIPVTKYEKTVSVITQAQLEASYSKNNYLSSLGVTGATLTPVFNKDTLEYTAELAPDTTSATITATVEDSKSTLSGNGAVTVTDGDNRLEIKVSAQNGALRTYVLTIKVKEYNPIEVTVDSKKLTVVRKKSSLTAPTNYTETTIKIGTEDVIAFTNKTTGYTLVGLKDAAGVVNYYIYNSKDNSYKLYQEFTFNSLVLYPIDFAKSDVPAGYSPGLITYNDKELVVYKYTGGSAYSLIYGMNVATGEKNIYMFDETENTLQIYNREEVDALTALKDKYLLMLVILSSVMGATLIGFVILGTMKYRTGKKSNKSIEKKLKDFKVEKLDNNLIDLSK